MSILLTIFCELMFLAESCDKYPKINLIEHGAGQKVFPPGLFSLQFHAFNWPDREGEEGKVSRKERKY
jgi:hypothetical protein